MNKLIKIIAIGLLLAGGAISYIYTAPYSGNAGLSRMPGVRIGGNMVEPPDDFSVFNDVGTNLIMKLDGFPPFVVYLAYVGTPEGVITGTRPDGGYWPQRVRDGRNEGWLLIGDETFATAGFAPFTPVCPLVLYPHDHIVPSFLVANIAHLLLPPHLILDHVVPTT